MNINHEKSTLISQFTFLHFKSHSFYLKWLLNVNAYGWFNIFFDKLLTHKFLQFLICILENTKTFIKVHEYFQQIMLIPDFSKLNIIFVHHIWTILYSSQSCKYLNRNWIKFQFCELVPIQVLNTHIWLVTIILNSTNHRHFHHCRKSYWLEFSCNYLTHLFRTPIEKHFWR